MTLLGKILKRGITISSAASKIRKIDPVKAQKKELKRLLGRAKYTLFGITFEFEKILDVFFFGKNDAFYQSFKKNVPIYDYEKMYSDWWHLSRAGKANVSWPGKIKYFALSSGTSDASSKAIPVSKAMVKAIQKTSVRQIISLGKYENIPSHVYESGYLMIGGSTNLNQIDNHFEGDLSGITTGKIPYWFKNFFKPGDKIASEKNWSKKIDQIIDQSNNWDIGFIAGVPAWLQIMMERIIEKNNIQNIHEIWPNLSVFAWGGVAFEPYKNSFEKLLGRPIHYVETYMASEGFLAVQLEPNSDMQLVLNNGIFFEFIVFNDTNFDQDGKLNFNAETIMIQDVQLNTDYALLISTCSGTWRYLIGDTIKFTDIKNSKIKITGRTKHFLSLCGEHLSIDNMNLAIESAVNHFKISINEFAVAGLKHDNSFAHHWYIGTTEDINKDELIDFIDKKLCSLNDDYITERNHVLKNLFITILDPKVFINWMKSKGKEGGQHKFPRVLKGKNLDEWTSYLTQIN